MKEIKTTHTRDERPWGNYEVLLLEEGYQVKRIVVLPGHRLSLQKHARRTEIWTVVDGEGIVTVDSTETPVQRGSYTVIPKGSAHRIACTGGKPLVFVEVQLGDYLGEDDIVRLEDDYKRS